MSDTSLYSRTVDNRQIKMRYGHIKYIMKKEIEGKNVESCPSRFF